VPKDSGDGTRQRSQHNGHERTAEHWVTPDGAFLYQIYGNAAKLLGYATQPDARLKELPAPRSLITARRPRARFDFPTVAVAMMAATGFPLCCTEPIPEAAAPPFIRFTAFTKKERIGTITTNSACTTEETGDNQCAIPRRSLFH